MQIEQEEIAKKLSIAFGECVTELGGWIDEKGVIDASTEGSCIIALAEINGARLLAKKVESALYE